MGTRRGQAFMELALGMLALALVLSALFGFTAYILSSLRMQRASMALRSTATCRYFRKSSLRSSS